jgi:hypothetical protein
LLAALEKMSAAVAQQQQPKTEGDGASTVAVRDASAATPTSRSLTAPNPHGTDVATTPGCLGGMFSAPGARGPGRIALQTARLQEQLTQFTSGRD